MLRACALYSLGKPLTPNRVPSSRPTPSASVFAMTTLSCLISLDWLAGSCSKHMLDSLQMGTRRQAAPKLGRLRSAQASLIGARLESLRFLQCPHQLLGQRSHRCPEMESTHGAKLLHQRVSRIVCAAYPTYNSTKAPLFPPTYYA
jgi:hypothetical protein